MQEESQMVNVREYEKQYSEEGFWEKVTKVAKQAGIKVVSNALLLYFSLQSERTYKEKTLILGALGYFILPLDLISDLLPVIGYSDDLSILLASIKLLKNITEDNVEKVTKVLSEKLHYAKDEINQLFNRKIKLLVVGHKNAGKTTFLNLLREEKYRVGATSLKGKKMSSKKICYHGQTITFKEMTDIPGEQSCKYIVNKSGDADIVICLFDLNKFLSDKHIVWECSAQFKAIYKLCYSKKRLLIATHINDKIYEDEDSLRTKLRDCLVDNDCPDAAQFMEEVNFITVNLKDGNVKDRILSSLLSDI